MEHKKEFKLWLQEDTGDGKPVMEKVVFFLETIQNNLLSTGIVFQVSFEIALIKFAWFIFIHSTNKTFENKVKHINNTENDNIIEKLYTDIQDKCDSAAYPFLYLKNINTQFEFFELIKEFI
jgi:hypothetical protein